MTVQEIYLSLLARVEKNITNGGIVLDIPRFVKLFNESQLRFIDNILDKKNDETIREIENLLEKDISLPLVKEGLNTVSFSFPDNFYEFSNVRIFASNDKCSKVTDFRVFPAKNENIEELLADIDNKPSFLYRETFYTIGDNCVVFYLDNFRVTDCFLTYYRYPVNIDMVGWVKEDGSLSTTIECEFGDRGINRILDICVKNFNKNEVNLQNYQIDKDTVYMTK